MDDTNLQSGPGRIRWTDAPVEPLPTNPNPVPPGTLKLVLPRPEAPKPEAITPEATQPETPKIEAGKPEETRLEAPKPEATRPATAGQISLPRYENLHHVRLGKWRVSYAVDSDRMIIFVLELIAPTIKPAAKAEKKEKMKIKWLNLSGR